MGDYTPDHAAWDQEDVISVGKLNTRRKIVHNDISLGLVGVQYNLFPSLQLQLLLIGHLLPLSVGEEPVGVVGAEVNQQQEEVKPEHMP